MKCQIHIPGPLVTGGPENCHQIADGLVRLGIDCRIQYYQTDAHHYRTITWDKDNPFAAKYRAEQRREGDGYHPTHHIFGSVDQRVAQLFPAMPRALHWNVTPAFCRKFIGMHRITEFLFGRSPRIRARALHAVEQLNEKGWLQTRAAWSIRRTSNPLLHAVQSHAAYCQLRDDYGQDPVLLFDYCHREFFETVGVVDSREREYDVVYQPRSEPHASVVLDGMGLKTRVLKGLARPQLIEILKSAKCYLDLGNHPGRDRLPREAVICGAVAVIGLAGTAKYFADVPCLPDLRVKRDDWEQIRRQIRMVVSNPGHYRVRQRYFAEEIKRQQGDFDRQLLSFVTRFERHNQTTG